MDKLKKALVIVAIVAIIAIAGSMIYYFAFFMPGIVKEEESSKAEEYKNEYNAIRQEFVDELNLYIGGRNKEPLQKLQEIRRKLTKLSVPEGYDKYNSVKISCLNAMDECISIFETVNLFNAAGATDKADEIQKLGESLLKNKKILESLAFKN